MTIRVSAKDSHVSIRGYGYVSRIRTRIRATMYSSQGKSQKAWGRLWDMFGRVFIPLVKAFFMPLGSR
jgi:hypothetical protein